MPTGASNTLGDITIKVEPEVMLNKANTISGYVGEIANRHLAMNDIMTRTSVHWNGEAAEAFRALYAEFKPIAESLLSRMREHVADLQQISGIYADVETKVAGAAAELPKDAIV